MEDKLGPKAISKKIKAKGLQKLKLYCELCEKQCRDENGFKCHVMSEGHLRQMQVFGENPDKFIEDFEDAFLGHLKHSHGFSRVAATVVYNEYISDRHHVHMNATKWLTLTQFVEYLGRTGKCKVDNTDKGLFIRYNNNDYFLFQGRRSSKRLLKSNLREEEGKQEREITKQIERAAAASSSSPSSPAVVDVPVPMEMIDEDGNKKKRVDDCESPNKKKKIAFAFSRSRQENSKGGVGPVVFEDVTNVEAKKIKSKAAEEQRSVSSSSSVGALEDLMREEEEAKDRKNRKPYWLCEGIVVKVSSKVWAEKGFYNKKGVVNKVLDNYIAEIQMIDNHCVLQIHQDHLQTVLSHIGGLVRMVNGSYRGFNARLLEIDTFNFCAKVQLDDKCLYQGRVLPQVAYEDICKLAL